MGKHKFLGGCRAVIFMSEFNFSFNGNIYDITQFIQNKLRIIEEIDSI